MVDEAAERGAGNLTVARVVARTGVSRRTFYELFESCEDCLLEAFEDAVERLATVVLPAYEQSGSWRARMRRALTAALECMARDRLMGRLLIVESLGAGAMVLKRRAWLVDTAIAAVEEGRMEPNGHGELPFAAEGVVGGVLSVLHARLLEDDPGGLVELVNPLMSMIVLPYLGPAAARKELDGPVPLAPPAATATRRDDPLRELEMRLTYRTVRVLRALAAQPGSSNRQVGDAAEVGDPGQTSKLLARLQGLGLIENIADRSIRGAPNSWMLTHRGREIQTAITTNTTPPD
jgi:AcrR family transcriptional regulator